MDALDPDRRPVKVRLAEITATAERWLQRRGETWYDGDKPRRVLDVVVNVVAEAEPGWRSWANAHAADAWRRPSTHELRIADLEQRVRELEAQLEERY